MIIVTQEIEKYFRESGWEPGRLNSAYINKQPACNIFADAIFKEFGGLNIGSCSPGKQMAAGNIYFFSSPISTKTLVTSRWEEQLGLLTPVADAHNDHIIIYVSESGDFYFYTDPDEKLYFGGQSFNEAMCKLLLGHSFGKEI
ncbi:MAG: SUKH-3 domain-containing protein [Pseudomonadota bacterium]